ncbi:oocyte zinc finger protein XlCOF29-like isoform X2 [Mixophyes fleayi]|uniref:oocyte zinc finger protein XlCOF29-like isoform X2 n=1 Tax=Mixophyes fleayi TaxID=3061075 RepID=UPI003F4E29B7
MMKNQLAERVLNLILEFVYLMTGEEYIVVKRSGEHGAPSSSPHISGGLNKAQSSIMEPPPHSLIHERNNDLKILELTNKIIHLLTGEDWLSSEEDLQLENEQPLRSPDKCLLENAQDRFFRPYSAPGGGNKHKRNIGKKLGRKALPDPSV